MQSPTTRRNLRARNLEVILSWCLSYALETLRGLGTTSRERHVVHSITPFRCISPESTPQEHAADYGTMPLSTGGVRARGIPGTLLEPAHRFSQSAAAHPRWVEEKSGSEGYGLATVPRRRRGVVGGDLADLGVATDALGESSRACLVLALGLRRV